MRSHDFARNFARSSRSSTRDAERPAIRLQHLLSARVKLDIDHLGTDGHKELCCPLTWSVSGRRLAIQETPSNVGITM